MRRLKMTKNRLTAFILVFAMLFTCIQPPVVAEAAGQTEDSTESVRGADIDNPTAGKWSYIYFGSYPQTEVTGDDLTDAIKNAAYNTNGDATVDGNKYRRIYTKRMTGTGVVTDNYLYFKWEPIRWRVLQKTDDELFIMSDIGLDNMPYHTESTTVTWDNSQMRDWLNGENLRTVYEPGYNAYSSQEESGVYIQYVESDTQEKIYSFYTTAFNAEQRSIIKKKESDRIFLLSVADVKNASYGFGAANTLRTLKASDYSHKKGSRYQVGNINRYPWWLKSDDAAATYTASINYDGSIVDPEENVDRKIYTCAPAMYISLDSTQWLSEAEMLQQEKDSAIKTLEDYRSAEDYRRAERKEWAAAVADGKDAIQQAKSLSAVASALEAAMKKIDGIKTDAEYEIEERGDLDGMDLNPKHHCSENGDEDTTDWKYIYMGYYPQTKVTDEVLIAQLKVAQEEQGSIDVMLDGEKYTKASGYNTTGGYYKWEPIKWRILQDEGDTLFVCADLQLDYDMYNYGGLYEDSIKTNWNGSYMKPHLNRYSNSFYNTAFNNGEKDAIVPITIDGEASSVYLLTQEEVTDEKYGFCTDPEKTSASRRMDQSDYSFVQEDDGDFRMISGWWLRSEVDWPDRTDKTANKIVMVYSKSGFYDEPELHGSVSTTVPYYYRGYGYYPTNGGIVPAMRISKNSGYWSFEKADKGLQYMKDVAIAELEAYLEEQDNYSEEQQKEREIIITEGINAIEAAKDKDAVMEALNAAKDALENIDDEIYPGLKAAREAVRKQISEWKNPDFLALYDEDDQTTIKEIADVLAEDTEGETDPSEIEELLAEAIKEVEALLTIKQKREAACREKLEEYAGKLADYDEKDQAELKDMLSEVEAALAEGDLDTAESVLKKVEEALREKAADMKVKAQEELEGLGDVQSDIQADEELDNDQREALGKEVQTVLQEAQKEIENAPDATAVKEALEKAKKTIEDIKEKVQKLKEEKKKVDEQLTKWSEDAFLEQYGDEEQTKIKEIAAKLAKDIQGKTEPSEIEELLAQALEDVAAIKTEQQKIDECRNKLKEYESKLADYDKEDQAELEELLEATKSKVEAALEDGDLEAAKAALAEMEAALEEKAVGKKEEAKKELDDIRESITEDKDLEEFDESQRAEIEAEINEALDAAKEEIENAKDATAVKEVLEKVKQTIEDIKQKGRDLKALKEAKEEVNQQIAAWNEENFLAKYSNKNQREIKAIAEQLGKDIEDKTDPSEIQKLLEQARAEVAAIKTEEQKKLEKALNQAQEAALKELKDLESKLGEYRDAEQEKIKKAIAEAKAKIEAAENEDAVKEALEAAKQVFKEQPTDAELTKQEADKKPTASLSLDRTTVTLYTGKASNSVTVKPTVTGASKTVTWTTSNPKVATVKDGKITAVGKGTATVTATANGISKAVQVTVKNPTITIKNGKKKFTKSKLTVKKKKKVVLTVTVNPKNAGISITKLTKKQKKIASVTLKKGKITIKGKKKGSFTLQIKSGKATKKIKITVK